MQTDTEKKSEYSKIVELAGALAHEIKNPLSTIKLNLQLLSEDQAEPATPKEKRSARKLEVLQKEVQRLSQTLDDFLRFIRMEQLTLHPADINDLLAEIGEFIEPELSRANIQLREQYAESLPKCPTDTRLLKQAILNIVLNAQNAMPKGGELIFRTSGGADSVTIEIIDTGSGMNETVRSRVFDAFYSTRKEGSGLGLAITKKIIEQHGGTISLQSEPGKGTAFTIKIPVQK